MLDLAATLLLVMASMKVPALRRGNERVDAVNGASSKPQ